MIRHPGLPGPSALSRRRLLQSSALGLAAAALAGAGFPVVARADDTPKRGGVLTMARTGDVVSFEPVVPSDNMSIWAKLLVFQLLIRTNPSGDGVVPDLATGWDVSGDKRTYTFHINPKAAFSDGTPVTSEDVEFSFHRAIYDKDSWCGSLFPQADHGNAGMRTPSSSSCSRIGRRSSPPYPYMPQPSYPKPTSRRSAWTSSATSRSAPARS